MVNVFTKQPSSNLSLNHITTVVYANGGQTQKITMEEILAEVFDKMYPINSLYITASKSTKCPIADYIPNSQWQLVSKDQCLQGTSSASQAENTKKAAIPNIKGRICTSIVESNYPNSVPTGPFYVEGTGSKIHRGSGTDQAIYMDASKISSVYDNSCKTVQPPAYLVNVWKRTA